ncbi:MAG: hypothetical protein U1E65_03815 [Myxococcota bacterium]
MNIKLPLPLLTLAALGACAVDPGGREATSSAISAAGGDACATLGDADWTALRDRLDSARALLDADVAANGVTGAYAAAPGLARDSIDAALAALDHEEAHMDSYGARNAVFYSLAYSIGLTMQAIVGQLQYSAHWASISVVYHRSAEARQVFETSLETVELANDIHARATRCYMNAYDPQ